MSFYTSLSGLQAAQTDMSTISHNLANVATNGFKKSRAEFADVIASNAGTSPNMQIGLGTVSRGARQQFGEGNLVQSTSALDMAISGDGFFMVKPDPAAARINYTRNGSFRVNDAREVTDGNGAQLLVYPVDGSGAVIGTTAASMTGLVLPATSGTPIATSRVGLGVNLNAQSAVPAAAAFDRFDPASYNQSIQTKIFDANGNPLTLVSYYRRETPPVTTAAGAPADLSSTWSVHSFVSDQPMTAAGSDMISLSFDASGTLTAPTAATTFDAFTPASSGVAQSFMLDVASGTSQLTQPFKLAGQSQDGWPAGQFENVTVDTNGIVKASYSNGDIRALGQVALATFTDPAGLKQLGSNYWSATGLSGAARLGGPDDNGFGKLMSNTIEHSNVDITEELVNLIAAQRNFQANSKALDTASQISQTIFNIRN